MADEHPPIHAAIYGESGCGKSTFAATFPKPMKVWCWDPLSKDWPYLKRGTATDFFYEEETGTPMKQVMSNRDGRLLIEVEYFSDADPTDPQAYERFLLRMHRFQRDEYEKWKTVVLDSLTFMELAVRKLQQYKLNPNPFAKAGSARGGIVKKGEQFDPRQWWAASTDVVEEMVIMRFGSLPMNVVLLCHVDKDTERFMNMEVHTPDAPGRVRGRIGSAFGEFYHQYVWMERDANNKPTGERRYLVQTKGDNLWLASSQINAPDPCEANYKSLWVGTDL